MNLRHLAAIPVRVAACLNRLQPHAAKMLKNAVTLCGGVLPCGAPSTYLGRAPAPCLFSTLCNYTILSVKIRQLFCASSYHNL